MGQRREEMVLAMELKVEWCQKPALDRTDMQNRHQSPFLRPVWIVDKPGVIDEAPQKAEKGPESEYRQHPDCKGKPPLSGSKAERTQDQALHRHEIENLRMALPVDHHCRRRCLTGPFTRSQEAVDDYRGPELAAEDQAGEMRDKLSGRALVVLEMKVA